MTEPTPTRRTLLRASAATIPVALAGCTGGATSPEPTSGGGSGTDASGGGNKRSFDGWMADVGNYDGVVDRTGSDAVTVRVGARANGGNYGFEPAAVRVSTGTTVTWEWTGKGGTHDVVAEDESFESELYGAAGATFEQTFDDAGTVEYYCMPHRTMGMKGVIVVE
ncbi:MAG: halocyanin domain-containing protein [Haloferacaceae archaeon]